MFLTHPRKLSDLLNEAHDGHLQLPDFQRSYVWEDEDIQSLIASVAKGYPIGASCRSKPVAMSDSNLVSWRELTETPGIPHQQNCCWMGSSG